MSLTDIFAAISDAMSTTLASVPLAPTYGPRYDSTSPPRVSFTPVREDFAPAQGQGGDYQRGPSGLEYRPGSSRALLTRAVTVEVRLWGGTLELTETMINAFFASVHDVVGATNYGALGAAWEDPYEADKLGVSYLVTLQLLIPVSRLVFDSIVAPINDAPLTPQVAQGGGQ